MNGERFPADDPREWLRRARSSLSQAKGGIRLLEVYLEGLCFQAQQAAEKAMKGVLIALRVWFPYTHDLAELLSLVEQAGQIIPDQIRVLSLKGGPAAQRIVEVIASSRKAQVGPVPKGGWEPRFFHQLWVTRWLGLIDIGGVSRYNNASSGAGRG